MIAKMRETNKLANDLRQKLADYEQISVSFKQEKTKMDKHKALDSAFSDLAFKYDKLSNEINIRMKQYLELAQQRK